MSVRIRVAMFAVLVFMAANLAANAQAGGAGEKSASTPTHPAVAGTADDQDTIVALKADLERMRNLLALLKTNAGFAANVTTPLYHQFELENAMWELEVNQLQRHLDALEHANKAPK